MKDEIKKIKIKTIGQLLDYVETEQKAKELINYITNLQEENERLKEIEKEHKNCIRKHWQQKAGETYLKYRLLQGENERLKKDLKTLWNVCWNNDTEMTSYQNEVFDNYYDMFHKNGGDEEC